jgi:hypothetical protein
MWNWQTQCAPPAQYETLIRPDFTLLYRGFQIPVSVDDTAGTLEARVKAYIGHPMRAAA